MGRIKTLLARLVQPLSEEQVREAVVKHADHILRDVEWRYAQARALEAGMPIGARQATAEDMNNLRHYLTGYTVTNNMNAAGAVTPGSIRWQALHIVYAGVDYTITDGASTMKYHYFVKPASGTSLALTSSDTKPTLGQDDLLVFINNGGTATVAATDGSASLPGVVADGAVDTSALADNAVTGTKVANSGIGAGKLATGAINLATQFGSKVVNQAALGDLAVGSGQLAANAVIAGKINAGAINGSTLFGAGVVDSNAVATGAVSAPKLNILSHTLY